MNKATALLSVKYTRSSTEQRNTKYPKFIKVPSELAENHIPSADGASPSW